MTFDLVTGPLVGRGVRLEPFTASLREEVRRAYLEDENAWSVTAHNCGRTGFDEWWAGKVKTGAGGICAFAVRLTTSGVVVGSSGYTTVNVRDRWCEIGSTYYAPASRGSAVNPETKRLLMAHAFSRGANRVEFRTDALNARSRAALLKLGAREEGVLRRHMVTWTGRVRDTVVFGVTDEDWPDVCRDLEARLAAFESLTARDAT